MIVDYHLKSVFLRRGRDSNPRNLSVQRFSRPPQSTTLPPLQFLRVCFGIAKVDIFFNSPTFFHEKCIFFSKHPHFSSKIPPIFHLRKITTITFNNNVIFLQKPCINFVPTVQGGDNMYFINTLCPICRNAKIWSLNFLRHIRLFSRI